MENQTLSKLFKNPAHKRGWSNEYATAGKLAIYYDRGLFELDELEPEAVEPVRQAIKEWDAKVDAHYAEHGG